MDEVRQKKIESQLQEEISRMIMRGEVKDPRISKLLTVSGASIAADMAYAKIRISAVSDDIPLQKAVDALNHAAGYIQKLLAKRIRLRFTPKLTFLPDTSVREGFAVNELIDQANREET